MEWTAESLYELVKNVPELWPEELEYDPQHWKCWHMILGCIDEGANLSSEIPPSIAARLIFAVGVEKLAGHLSGITLLPPTGCRGGWDIGDSEDSLKWYGFGPTPLHAVVAAWKALKQ
jgi:hypothetical protein